MDELPFGDVTPRNLLLFGGPPVALVSVLVVLTRVRPSLGWPALMGTLMVAGVGIMVLGTDTTSGNLEGAVRYGDSEGNLEEKTRDGGLATGWLGLLSVYCLATALLCLVYLAATVAVPSL